MGKFLYNSEEKVWPIKKELKDEKVVVNFTTVRRLY